MSSQSFYWCMIYERTSILRSYIYIFISTFLLRVLNTYTIYMYISSASPSKVRNFFIINICRLWSVVSVSLFRFYSRTVILKIILCCIFVNISTEITFNPVPLISKRIYLLHFELRAPKSLRLWTFQQEYNNK